MDSSSTVEEACWEEAVDIFNEKLTNDKEKIIPRGSWKNATQPCDGLEELIRANREAYRKTFDTRRPRFKRLGEALQTVHKFAPVFDVMVQQQSFIAVLVWGPMRFVIQLLAAESRAGPEIWQGLERIASSVPRLLHGLKLYAKFPGVVKATAAIFAKAICFLVNARAFLDKPPIRRAFNAVPNSKLDRCLNELEKEEEILAQEIRAANGQAQAELQRDHNALVTSVSLEFAKQGAFRAGWFTLREARHSLIHENVNVVAKALPQMCLDASAVDDAQRRARGCDSISAWLQENSTKAEIAAEREPGTCEWVHRSAEYNRWVQTQNQGVLWIQGKAGQSKDHFGISFGELNAAGCGKSVLATYLAACASTDVVLTHFFYCSRRRTLAATAYFAVSLLSQLLSKYEIQRSDRFPFFIEKASPLVSHFNSGLECPADMLLAVLDDALTLVSSFTLIVDALDECTDPEDCDRILGYLGDLGSRSNTQVILLTRAGKFRQNVFTNAILISMEGSVVESDIRLFVEGKIERNGVSNPGLLKVKPHIASKISSCSQGMFLLARLVMDDIKTAGTVSEIRVRLDKAPTALDDYYQRNMEETARKLHERDKITRHSIFLLLIGGPLTPEDISTTLALNTKTHCVDEDELFSNPTREVLRLCEPLVTIVKGQVQFVHTSAKDFLLKFVVAQEDSDAFLARKCLSKLSQSQYRLRSYPARLLRMNLLAGVALEVGLEPTTKESIPYRYACLHWQDHVTALRNPSDELLAMLSRFLLGNEFVTWSETLFQIKSRSTIGSQIQVQSDVREWFGRLPDETKEKIPINSFFVRAHESLSNEFMREGEDIILPYLPLIRLGQYFNVGGKTNADFQKAYQYKMTVAEGFEAALGTRSPLTLRAKTEFFKEFFFQKRFDEAERGFEEVARIQQEVVSEDVPDIFITLQLLGLAQICVTKFQQAISTLTEAADGFRRLSGDKYFLTLQTELFRGQALERGRSLREAYDVYDNTLKLWIPIGGPAHPFSLMLKTAFGSVCRKLGCFAEAEEALLGSLTARKRLFTTENVTYVDSVLQLAALYYENERGKDGLEYLGLVQDSAGLKDEFERECQEKHIRALINLEAGFYTKPKTVLQRLLDEASGQGRNKNNRELLWVRITLADVLRQRGKYDEALMVFSDLVSPRLAELPVQAGSEDAVGYKFPSSLVDEPEPPAQLTIAERALRLLRDAKQDDAELLLQENGLKWKRQKDFWVLQGGPITDTASMSGLKAFGFKIIDHPSAPDDGTTHSSHEQEDHQDSDHSHLDVCYKGWVARIDHKM
ncbi:hypothetical protein EPUS_08683 [Endocarpon pusillum Z07020]|uniref:NACHT domain-containing protein n=1 Tax=Endocarpon pusillum (strain Z07020 / HMAS-L-300199) TaxID=1263415 RepID=U1HQP2_ENDPU|nr:uncharacterized protein EPUS_08683 [Endocarpon pusillum Z07020]ERF71414.1 hypothetical protein EPUS_08683 [Endocarpon pusillum Z07020]